MRSIRSEVEEFGGSLAVGGSAERLGQNGFGVGENGAGKAAAGSGNIERLRAGGRSGGHRIDGHENTVHGLSTGSVNGVSPYY